MTVKITIENNQKNVSRTDEIHTAVHIEAVTHCESTEITLLYIYCYPDYWQVGYVSYTKIKQRIHGVNKAIPLVLLHKFELFFFLNGHCMPVCDYE